MSTQSILAEKTVSVTELRKHPTQYFLEEPVAVLSNNKTAGYMVGRELFEKMVRLLDEKSGFVASTFRPARARIEVINHLGAELLLAATDDELGDFEE